MNLPRLLSFPGRRPAGGQRRRAERPLNLARRPFVNRRPVARTALVLTVVAVVLLALNVFLYARYVGTRRADASELTRIEAEIVTERQRIAAARADLAEADIEHQNRLVTYLNQRIDERTFGWSVLFDRLADVMPEGVRIESLAPELVRESRPGRAVARTGERRATLAIQAQARDGESVLRFIDALFADEAFESPDLKRESIRDGEVSFQLDVVYLPDRAEATTRRPAAATTAAEEGR